MTTAVVTLARRARYRIVSLRHRPVAIAATVLVVVLAYTVLAPVIALVVDAFTVHIGDQGVTGAPGTFTTAHLQRVFASDASQRLFWEPLGNTIQLAVLATTLTVALGVAAGWLVSRTDVWGGSHWRGLLMTAYMIPSWAFAQAWFTVFRNSDSAGTPGLLTQWGLEPPNWLAYGLVPSALILSLHTFPIVMVLVADAFERVDAAGEEQARILGASTWTVLRTVSLPGIRPAVTSAVLLIAANTIGDFGVPYVLGLPVRWNVLSTSMYSALRGSRAGETAVFASVIIAIGGFIILFDSFANRNARRFQSVSGASMALSRMRLRAARVPAGLVLGGLGAFAVLFPVIALGFSTLYSPTAGADGGGGLTLEYWIGPDPETDVYQGGLLRMPEFWSALRNSLVMAGGSAIAAAALGLVIGYCVHAGPRALGAALRHLSFLPYLVPGIALAAGLIALFVVPRGPIPALYGTMALVVIGMVIDHLPFGARTGIAANAQLGTQLEEAARVSGARWRTAVGRITVPLLAAAFSTAAVIPFVSALKTLSIPVMLSTTSLHFLPSLSLSLAEYGADEQGDAITLIITFIAIGGGLVLRRVTGTGLTSAAI